MPEFVKKTVTMGLIAVGLFAGMYTFGLSLGLYESRSTRSLGQSSGRPPIVLVNETSVSRSTNQASRPTPSPIPQRILQKMRDRGMSEQQIQRMLQMRKQSFSSGKFVRRSSAASHATGDIKSIERFIANAPKVDRVKAPADAQRLFLLIAPFELDQQWYRNQATSLNMADLLMAKLNDQPGVRLVDRQQVHEALGEMSLALSMDSGQVMQLGALLKANLILRCSVEQDVKAGKTQLRMRVIDVRRADILVQQKLLLQAPPQGYFNPTESDISQIATVAQTLVGQALKVRRDYATQTIIAPLFLRNTTDNDRLDHYEAQFRKLIAESGKPSNMHILNIAGLDDVLGEEVLSLTGLSQSDPNAWQYVADQYLWGYFREESHPDNTPVNQIPVTITIDYWDGLNVPVSIHQSTTIGRFEQGLKQITRQISQQIKPRKSKQICQGLAAQLAVYLSRQERQIIRTLPKANTDTPTIQRTKDYCRFLLDLARFFDSSQASIAMTRGELNKPVFYVNSWDQLCQAYATADYWQQFLQRFGSSKQSSKAVKAMHLYISTLTAIAGVYEQKPLPDDQDYRVFDLRYFPPDMPLEAIQKQIVQLLDRIGQLPELYQPMAANKGSSQAKRDALAFGRLGQAVEKITADDALKTRTHDVVMQVANEIKHGTKSQTHALSRKQKRDQKASSSQVLTAQVSSTPAAANSGVDPQIIKRVQRVRKGKMDLYARMYQGKQPVLQQLAPHRAVLLDVPQLHPPIFPVQTTVLASTNIYNPRRSQSKSVKLACDADHIWFAQGANLVYYNAASGRLISNVTQIPRDPINDLLVYQGKLYVAQEHRGLSILDMNNWQARSLGTPQGLLKDRVSQLARVGDELLGSHRDYRLSMVNIADLSVTERQVKSDRPNVPAVTGRNLVACGDWLLVDQRYLFEVRTGKVRLLGSVLQKWLGDQFRPTAVSRSSRKTSAQSGSSFEAELAVAGEKVFWLTTSTGQLIRLDMAANQADAWDLPLAKPDWIAATSEFVYMAYRESSGASRKPNRSADTMPWQTHLLVWDIGKQQLSGRITLPGDMYALAAQHGDLWTVLKRAGQWQLVRIITSDAQASRFYAIDQIKVDQLKAHGPRSVAHDVTSLAYAGQLEPITPWLADASQRDQDIVKRALAAACFRADTQPIITLAQWLIKNGDDDGRRLFPAILNAAALGRMELYKQLFAMARIQPASNFSPDHPYARRSVFDDNPKIRRWKSQALFLAQLRQAAVDYGRPKIDDDLSSYHLPINFSQAKWFIKPPQTTAQTRYTTTPLAMAVRLLDRPAFDRMLREIRSDTQHVDQPLLLAALNSHDPYYLKQLLTQNKVGLGRSPLDFQGITSAINPQRLAELLDWAFKQDQNNRVTAVFPLIIALKDSQQIEKLLTKVSDRNSPQLVELFLKTHDPTVLELLRKQGWDVLKHTPMTLIDRNMMGDIRLVDWLIQQGYALDQIDKQGQTLLLKAARYGNAATCYLLLDAGANVRIKDKAGRTAIDLASNTKTKKIIKAYLSQKSRTQPAVVFQSKPRPGDLTDRDVAHKLLKASVNNDGQQVLQCLAWGGNLFDSSTYTGRYNDFLSPLMYASARGQTNIASELLAAGDPINRQINGWTALMYASANGHADIVTMLLAHHADWQIENDKYQTAMDLAQMYHYDQVVSVFEDKGVFREDGRQLMRAVLLNDGPRLRKMVQKQGYDINAIDKTGGTALFMAMNVADNGLTRSKFPPEFYTHYNMADLLLELGADVNHQDRYGRTILHHLLNARLVNMREDDDVSEELQELAIRDICKPLQYMMNQGADPALADNQGQTCFNMAESYIVLPALKKRVMSILKSGK